MKNEHEILQAVTSLQNMAEKMAENVLKLVEHWNIADKDADMLLFDIKSIAESLHGTYQGLKRLKNFATKHLTTNE